LPAAGRKLIASVWHTVMLLSIFMGVTMSGALFQWHAQSTPGMLQQHQNVMALYLSVIAIEWFLACPPFVSRMFLRDTNRYCKLPFLTDLSCASGASCAFGYVSVT
jgi:hypothetical protein